MENNYFTKEELKQTYTYQLLKRKTGIYIACLIVIMLPFMSGIVSLLCVGAYAQASPLIFLGTVGLLVFAIIAIVHIDKQAKFLAEPSAYKKYTSNVVGYEVESRPRGRYGSCLVVNFKVLFTTVNGMNTVRRFEAPMTQKIYNPDKLKSLRFNIGYDEIHDRLCVCDDVPEILRNEEITY